MKKEERKEVDKSWGGEIWLVNNIYCGKLLVVEKNKECSYHYHKNKQETFICLEGHALLTIEGKEYDLNPMATGKTIFPGEYHKFKGLDKTLILEVSTHHEDEDTYRMGVNPL